MSKNTLSEPQPDSASYPPSDYSIHQKSFLSPPWHIQHSQDDILWRWLPFTFSSSRNHHFLLHGQSPFLHPAGSFFFPYHLLSLVCGLDTYLLSLSLELDRSLKTAPAMSRRQVVSSFSAFINGSFHVSDDDDFKQYLKISMVLSSLKIHFTFVKSL